MTETTPAPGTVLDPDGRPVITPAVLGWKNPDDDGRSLRLYALDRGPSPRWDRSSSPTGRTVECAVAGDTFDTHGAGEGDRYLVVRVGDRYTDEEAIDLFAKLLGRLVEEASREDGAIVTDRTTGAEIRLRRPGR